jgi:hypothetical protein
MSTALAFISVYIAGLGLLLDKVNSLCKFSDTWWGFIIAAACSLVLFVVALVFCWRTFYGYGYHFISPGSLDDYETQMIQYYGTNYKEHFSKAGKKEDLIENDFIAELKKQYCDMAEVTHKNNKLKQFRFKRFSSFFFIAVMIIGFELIILSVI